MRIDAHQHFWDPARGDYTWMPKDNATLYRPYGPKDFEPLAAPLGITHSVVVQAAATTAETDYLLSLASATDGIAGVVGWIDFEDPTHMADLERFRAHPKFRGVRPMIQDIANPDWMLRDDLAWAFEAITAHGLTFDALGFSRHLENFAVIAQRYPGLSIVIDHAMKPQIHAREWRTWAEGIRRLARLPLVHCKLSGLITEAGADWSVADLRPYVDHLLTSFGPRRLMWGSDWPVCQMAGSYSAWFEAAEQLTQDLTESERDQLFGQTANRFYRLGL